MKVIKDAVILVTLCGPHRGDQVPVAKDTFKRYNENSEKSTLALEQWIAQPELVSDNQQSLEPK